MTHRRQILIGSAAWLVAASAGAATKRAKGTGAKKVALVDDGAPDVVTYGLRDDVVRFAEEVAERPQGALHPFELAHPRVDAMAVEPGPDRAGQRQPAQRADQQESEVFPGRRSEAHLLQDVQLLAARVVEDPLVPAVVDGFPGAAQLQIGRAHV